jgi:ribosomal protein S18 acetylase RimI-like enzyme
MNELAFRIVEKFPEPAFSELSREAFADYEPSRLLTEVMAEEAVAASGVPPAAEAGALRIGCFRGDALLAWTFARRAEGRQLHMINSGVAPVERRHGIYSQLVKMTIEHAFTEGSTAIASRHTVHNNPVIIAKLKLGFFVSGFEYSEVYGPLVRLTYLVSERRRSLHQTRSRPLRRADPNDA